MFYNSIIMISFVLALLLAKDVAGKRGHVIKLDHLESRKDVMQGHVFLGSKVVPMKVLFDTMSTDTAFTLKQAFGQEGERLSDYDFNDSESAKRIKSSNLKAAGNSHIQFDKYQTIEYATFSGQSVLQGYTLTDRVCIADQANLAGMMGRMAPLCQADMQFLGVEDIEPDFSFGSAQGIIGLAPDSDSTMPRLLKSSGALSDATVSFHADSDGNPVVSIGETISRSTKGVKHFFNLGEKTWALPLSHIFYNYEQVLPKEFSDIDSFVPTRLAHIDSVSSSIQIGPAEFEIIKKKMMQEDKSIEAITVSQDPPRYSLMSKMKCEILAELLSDLQFDFGEDLMITISPAGYLIDHDDKCQIALQSSSDFQQVRLGAYFLKNSYVQLDFDNNMIILGSKDAVNAISEGGAQQPQTDDNKPTEPEQPADHTDEKPSEPEQHNEDQDEHQEEQPHDDDQHQGGDDKPTDDHYGKPGENPNADDDNDHHTDEQPSEHNDDKPSGDGGDEQPTEPEHHDEGSDDVHNDDNKPDDDHHDEPEQPTEPTTDDDKHDDKPADDTHQDETDQHSDDGGDSQTDDKPIDVPTIPDVPKVNPNYKAPDNC